MEHNSAIKIQSPIIYDDKYGTGTIILSEISQAQKDEYHMLTSCVDQQKMVGHIAIESEMVVTRSRERAGEKEEGGQAV
jgi:hypothetical protein